MVGRGWKGRLEGTELLARVNLQTSKCFLLVFSDVWSMVLVELGRKRIGWSNLCKRFNIHTFEIRIFSSKNFISRSFVEEKVEILYPEDCFAKKLGNSEKNKGWNRKGRKSLGWSMFSPAKPSQRTLEISAPVRGTILASRIAWVQHTQVNAARLDAQRLQSATCRKRARCSGAGSLQGSW